MQQEVMFAGFGGQGIMSMGQFVAYTGMEEGKEVCWLPSYGPEMRGGTAYCNVVVSGKPIGSPVIDRPIYVVVMNRPSLDKFGPIVKPGGLLCINSSLIDVQSDREDIDQLLVPANDIANDMGAGRSANIAMLGAFVGRTQIIGVDNLRTFITKKFGKNPAVAELNMKILEKGLALGAEDRKKKKK
ncbi:MAG: 2-oxoacid:acceptor oxidoreductase family protein [Planctomycetota bacterium]|jgi:2-oxoglutarate ferredoxin oxidoreductase subunit gamma